MHNIGKAKSEPARKAIEEQYNLIKAETASKKTNSQPTALELLPAKYGKEETKQTITNIIGEVLRTYKFANLTELNIILRQRNILADRGPANKRMYEQGGLVYSLLDNKGYRIGIPIKASDIYGGPVLKTLEKQFAVNAVRKLNKAKFTRSAVFYSLTQSQTMRQFSEKLRARNISLHFDEDLHGKVQAIYFIDHRNKAAFSNKELGMAVSDFDRLRMPVSLNAKRPDQVKPNLKGKNISQSSSSAAFIPFATHSTQGIIDILLRPQTGQGGSAAGGPKKKKKRRRPPL